MLTSQSWSDICKKQIECLQKVDLTACGVHFFQWRQVYVHTALKSTHTRKNIWPDNQEIHLHFNLPKQLSQMRQGNAGTTLNGQKITS